MAANEKFVNYYIEHLTDTTKEFLLNAITNKTNLRLTQELIDDYTKKVVEQDKIIADLRSEIELVKSGADATTSQKISVLESDIQSHVNTITKLNDDITRLNALKEENEKNKQQLVHLETFKNDLIKTREENQKIKSEYEAKYNDVLKEKNDVLAEKNRILGEHNGVKAQLVHLDTFKNELQKTRDENQKLKSDYEAKIAELNKQVSENTGSGVNSDDVQKQIDAVKSEYESKIAALNDQLANVQPVVQTVVQEADTSAYDAKIADLTNQINQLNEQNQKNLNDYLSKLAEVANSAGGDNSTLVAEYESKIADLTQKLNEASQVKPVDTSAYDAKIAELTTQLNNAVSAAQNQPAQVDVSEYEAKIDALTKKYEAKIVEMTGVKNNLVSMYESQIHELSNNSGAGSEIEKKYNDLVEEHKKYKATADKRILQLNNQSNLIRADYEKKLTEAGNQKNNLNAMYEKKISEMQNQITQLQSLKNTSTAAPSGDAAPKPQDGGSF